MNKFRYVLGIVATGCASLQNSPNQLEFEVENGVTYVDGMKIGGTISKFGPDCRGQDILVQRDSGNDKYVELVRKRDCVRGDERFDYRDFTPTNELEDGPRMVEVILPDNTCLYRNPREDSGWKIIDCKELEKL